MIYSDILLYDKQIVLILLELLPVSAKRVSVQREY